MNRKSFFSLAGLLVGLGCFGSTLQAGTIQYLVTLDTSGFSAGTAGFIDVQFNQANAGALSGVATIDSYSATGYTFDDSTNAFTAGVTGSFSSLPLVIPNDQGGANYFAQGISNFGSSFSFALTLSGPVSGGTATDVSELFVILEDTTGAPIFGSEVASITVNTDGSTTPAGSSFQGGSASVALVTSTPEPSTMLIGFSGLLMLARRFRR